MCLKLKVTIRVLVCECEQNEEKPNARSDSTRNLWSQNQKMLKLKNGCPWYFPPHLTGAWCWLELQTNLCEDLSFTITAEDPTDYAK